MKIAKWGNSLAVRIPKDVAEALGFKEGDEVTVRAAWNDTMQVGRTMTREEAIEGLRKYRGLLPADFKFDRDEANAR